jgi:A/G-specific adenine glycosylase
VQNNGGVFPTTFKEVLALPGVGRYTAGALCSIAFNQPTPVLDGNVTRVLTRLFGITGQPQDKTTQARLWDKAQRLVNLAAWTNEPRDRACSHLNQSLMELGALVCTPRQPACPSCSVRRHCFAFQTNRVTEFPSLGPSISITPRRFVAFVVSSKGRYLVRKRPDGVVNGGMWEFPNIELKRAQRVTKRMARVALGRQAVALDRLATITHSITRFRITVEVFNVRLEEDSNSPCPEGVWRGLDQLQLLAFPSAQRRILELIIPPSRANQPRIAASPYRRTGRFVPAPAEGKVPTSTGC